MKKAIKTRGIVSNQVRHMLFAAELQAVVGGSRIIRPPQVQAPAPAPEGTGDISTT